MTTEIDAHNGPENRPGVDSAAFDELCHYCAQVLPWNRAPCPVCALPGGAQHCRQCQQIQPNWNAAFVPLVYSGYLIDWVQRLKFHNGLVEARLLAQIMTNHLKQAYVDQSLPDYVIAVPLHWRRMLWRGYNQSSLLSRQICHQLGLCFETRAVKRIRATPAQQQLSRQQRSVNLHGAFTCSKDWQQATVAVVDDVLTTGATMQAITALLKQHNAGQVHLWCATRTPAP